MKIKLLPEEETLFQALSQEEVGKRLQSYLKRVIDAHADIRAQTGDLEVAKKAMLMAQEMVEDNIINHLKTFSGESNDGGSDYR